MTESWAPIPDLPYEASTEGNIRSVPRTVARGRDSVAHLTGQPIATFITRDEPCVSLSPTGSGRKGSRNFRVARLVLLAHVGPPDGRVKHVNGDRMDVRLANLQWGGVKAPKVKEPRPPRAAAKRPAPRPPAPPKPAPTEAVIDLTGLPMMSPNGRPNHFARARDTHTIRHSVAWRARAARIPTGLDHCTIEYHYRPAEDRYAWDQRNLASAGIWKAAQDALHAHRGRNNGPAHPIVHDDSPGFMTEIGPTQHPARKGEPAATWLVIRWTVNTEKAS